MKITELVAGHTNTDFDAFAGTIAAAKLYPHAHIWLPGAMNRNVRQFARLYADHFPFVETGDLDPEDIVRLILVETRDANRLADLAPVFARAEVEVVAFDHHDLERPEPARPMQLVTTTDGAVTTLLLRIIAERGLPVTPLEATVFALGIHEDTGSLTFTTTTGHDAEALAYCMHHGASTTLIERFLHQPLGAEQRDLLSRALSAAVPVPAPAGTYLVAALAQDDYVEEISVVAHALLDVTGADAVFLLLRMEDRVFVVARSRLGALDVDDVLHAVGGGGHAAAASGVVRSSDLEQTERRLREAVVAAAQHVRVAAEIVSGRPLVVDHDETIDQALVACTREGLGGAVVSEDDVLTGSVGADDLRRALRHGLGHAPVKAVMSRLVPTVAADRPAPDLPQAMTGSPTGHLLAVRETGDGPLTADDVLGVVRGEDVLGVRVPGPRQPGLPPGPDLSGRLTRIGLDDLLDHIQAIAAGYAGVYLVGGAVRDLLLSERSFDIDVAVEGDGIAFAHELARRLGGHVRPHQRFRTAVVVASEQDGNEDLRVDVASTRTEFYSGPAELPSVEPAPLQSDLARRDFAINAMAVSLGGGDFGTLYDPFAGARDLSLRRIRVLHNLSFIEDPTRIFRALRYESRYGFRMDAHTYGLARACVDMGLVGDLSSARLRDELLLLLREPAVDAAVRRLHELRLTRAIHPRFRADQATRDLLRATGAIWRRHGLGAEAPLWRLRLAAMVRELEPEEVLEWAQRMRFKRADADVLARSYLVAGRLAQIAQSPASDADLRDAAGGEPLEAVVLAIALDRDHGIVARRLGVYLERTRHIRLEVGGHDLRAMGYPQSPALGDALHSILRLKIDGVVQGREAELAAAQRLLGGAR